MPRIGVVLVAAGSGTRLGLGIPKALARVGGKTLLELSLSVLERALPDSTIAIVAPAAEIAQFKRIASEAVHAADVRVVAGGGTRQESVWAGLRALGEPADGDIILVHDAARPFVPMTVVQAVADAVRMRGVGVIPVLPVVDTVRHVEGDVAGETVDRDHLCAVQTPQGFPAVELYRAYERASRDYTDDAALFQAAGGTVHTIPGSAHSHKITTPRDLEAAVRDAQSFDIRTGIGVDTHAFADGTELWLAGLFWPEQSGLSGHSDGDAVAHAMCDALLSAAGKGDIGGIFGTADPALDGAHGEVFLSRTKEIVEAAGFSIVNVAVQVVGNRPKIGTRREEAERELSRILGAPVSLAATTSDALGAMGRGEGVTAIASALVRATAS